MTPDKYFERAEKVIQLIRDGKITAYKFGRQTGGAVPYQTLYGIVKGKSKLQNISFLTGTYLLDWYENYYQDYVEEDS